MVHSPGAEIESVSPDRATEALYNDILPMSAVRQEHEKLVAFLSTVAEVYEFRDLLEDAARSHEGRRHLLRYVLREASGPDAVTRLSTAPPCELVAACIEGLPGRAKSLSEYLESSLFALPPVPNLYFMRDVAMVIGERVVPARMAHPVRRRESLLAEVAFRHAGSLAGAPLAWEHSGAGGGSGPSGTGGHRVPDISGNGPPSAIPSLEGGDVLVRDANTLIIGVSERTSPRAIDDLVAVLLRGRREPLCVYAVLLPKERATIHLDMAFSFLDSRLALIHEPVILGPDAVPTVRAVYRPDGEHDFTRWDNLILALDRGGHAVETVVCGGGNRLRQQREQWLSGTNVFAFAPGKVVAYDCNEATLAGLERAGFAVRNIDDFVSGRENVDAYRLLAVAMRGSDLARGGGGPRCMTLPIRRHG